MLRGPVWRLMSLPIFISSYSHAKPEKILNFILFNPVMNKHLARVKIKRLLGYNTKIIWHFESVFSFFHGYFLVGYSMGLPLFGSLRNIISENGTMVSSHVSL